jgi:yersiniabactin nonribosomal peptide synthetase
VHDLRFDSEKNITFKLNSVRDKLSHRRLAVEKGEVIGLELSVLPEGKTRIHFDIDLLVADVQSLQIILRDLAAAYARGSRPAAPIHWNFAQYLKQEAQRRSPDIKNDKQYWKQRLNSMPGPPGLPLKEQPEAIKSPVFKQRKHLIDSTDWTRLRKQSLSNKITPAMALLSAYAEILDRWSTRSRFLINIPLFDRQTGEPGIDDVVADFTNLLLLEVDCGMGQSFLERARSIQSQFHEDVAHSAYSGVQVQRDMARVRQGERMFAPVVFASNIGTPFLNLECRETLGELTYMISQTPQVWLDFQLYETEEGLLLTWDAVDALFPEGMIDEMFTAYTRLINWLVADNNDWGTSPDVFPASQQERRRRELAISFPQPTRCLHTSFFHLAAVNPQKTALIDSSSNSRFSYGELSERALRIAAFLKKEGVMMDEPVAVTLPRGIEQINAVFGILAAGACYTPVSIEQPFARRDRIHQKAAIRYVLSDHERAQNMDWPEGTVVLDIADAAETPPLSEPVAMSAERLAYIIFTSGSTGEPKGVEIEHGAAWNTVSEINRRYHVNEADRILAVSALDFDLSVYDIFGLLSAGGSLVLITDDTRRDAAFWLKALKKYQVTLWNSVPILLDMLLVVAESERQKSLPLRLAMLSGDWIGLDLPQRLHHVAENCQLVAMGGATEASIWSNAFDLTLPLPAHWKSIPYGRPLANQAYRVVDSKGRECPDWVTGELWIGGAGVARGYRGEPELTADRFVELNDSRWYRTGDLGRFWPDGNIEFLGREDFQVKIRGHRIELGEIETALKQHPEVRDAVVTAVGEKDQGKRLIGYVVSDKNDNSSLFDIESLDSEKVREKWNWLVNTGRKQAQQSPEDTDIQSFTALWQGMENLSATCMCHALTKMGVFIHPGERHSLEHLIQNCGIKQHYEKLVGQWLKVLVEEGMLRVEDNDVFVNPQPLPNNGQEELWEKIGQYAAQNTDAQILFEYFKQSCENHVPMLRGEIKPLELFFPEGSWRITESLYQHNPIARYYNCIVGEIMATLARHLEPTKHLKILEVGAGTGGTSAFLLPELKSVFSQYFYTDLTTFFTSNAKSKFKDYSFIQYGLLDIDHDPETQGYEPCSFDVIAAANVLHDARNLEKTMHHLQSLLVPGGLMLILEGTRNIRLQMISVGFIEGFSHFEDERIKDNLPLLSVPQWRKILDSAGFERTEVFPESNFLGKAFFEQHVLLAQAPERVERFKAAELRHFLHCKLPEYMVPSLYMRLDELPLSLNGKVDRKNLPMPIPGMASNALKDKMVAPRTPMETTIADIWEKVLKTSPISIHDNFFELGGDSLLAIQITTSISKSLKVKLPLDGLFNALTIAELTEHIKTLLQEQDAKKEREARFPQIIPAPHQAHHPFALTDIQQAYWIGRKGGYELGNVAAHCYFEIEGIDLDHERISTAWRRLIDHHGMMRAIILADGRQQILQDVPPYQIKIINLRGKDSGEVEFELSKLREEMSHQIFPVDQWPLFDVRLSYFGRKHTRLHISFDNIIFDGWSMFHLLSEWNRLYHDPDAPLPPLDLTFRDYVLAINALQGSTSYQNDREYWFNRLSDLPAAPELPLAKRPGDIVTQRFTRLDYRLERATWQRLKKRASGVGLTPPGVLLAAYAEILSAWSRNPRFTINLTLFNRFPLHPQVNDIVGDFTSLTLLAIDNTAGATFLGRARNLQQQLWRDLDHPHIGGVAVLRELAKLRGRHRGGLMPVVFTSALGVDSWSEDIFGDNWMGKLIYNISQTPQVWLDHQAMERKGDLFLIWDAVEGLFPDGLLYDMFSAYHKLLSRLADDDTAWKETILKLVPASQIEKRIGSSTLPVTNDTLDGLFEKQAVQRPFHPAVICSNRTMNYTELRRRSNDLGYLLRKKGARPNTLVAVVMEKGWEQVVAVLGTLMSGAAYLPIDPAVPGERLRHLLRDGEVSLVLTQSWLGKRLDWSEGIVPLYVDQIALTDKAVTAPETGSNPDNLAYVIYTSGSTGLPKGVMTDHRGAVNTILDLNHRFNIGSDDRVLAVSNLNFDLSVYDIFGSLAAGATIVLPDAMGTKDPTHWLRLMNRERVTIWNSVPAFIEMLLAYLSGKADIMPNSLRLALLSGDWIPLDLPHKIRSIRDDIKLISLGGATEASIWSVLYPIEEVNPDWKSIPYGRAMRNQNLHVLNEFMEDCPDWVPGQLYISGIGLAKGYWRDEKKTNDSFIIHPRTGKRLYRTGDLGRYLPDGNIEFLGREDFQVKIGGHRIELGEIEATLRAHPDVTEAIVTSVGDIQGNKRLVGYVTCRNDGSLSASELRGFLKEKLPGYMIPSFFQMIEAFPLTPNGKVDRKALPKPDESPSDQKIAQIAPRNETEKAIAAILKEVLGKKTVGVHDNFFDIGANSIQIVRLQNKMTNAFKRDISILTFFEHTTISALAAYLNEDRMRSSFVQHAQRRAKLRKTTNEIRLRNRKKNREIKYHERIK